MKQHVDEYFRRHGDRHANQRLEAKGGKATPWPELPVPPGTAVNCDDFGLAGHGRLVWAEGDGDASVMFLLDNPGARETPDGVPYVCGTRQTLRRAATEAGFDTDRLYITFLLKCRPRRAYDRQLARSVGLRHVHEQVDAAVGRIEVIVLFGDVVVKTATGDDAASVRTLRGENLSFRGKPAVATYHPLAARRRPNLYPLIVDDLTRARTLSGIFP